MAINITHLENEIIDQYLYDENTTRPWIIGFRIYKTKIDMSKQEGKYKKEADLLRKSCKQEPKDLELIQDLLALQKTKSLMIRKRGLQSDIESRLDQYIMDLNSPINMN